MKAGKWARCAGIYFSNELKLGREVKCIHCGLSLYLKRNWHCQYLRLKKRLETGEKGGRFNGNNICSF